MLLLGDVFPVYNFQQSESFLDVHQMDRLLVLQSNGLQECCSAGKSAIMDCLDSHVYRVQRKCVHTCQVKSAHFIEGLRDHCPTSMADQQKLSYVTSGLFQLSGQLP